MVYTIDGEQLTRRILVTIDGSQVTTQTGIPLMLNIDLPNVATDGKDVRLAKLDGTPIAREIECVDVPNTDSVTIHYSFDTVASTDSQFYVYWGNASLSEPAADSTYGREAVYASGYDVVYNMAQVPASLIDSTSNNRDITTVAGSMGSEDLIDGNYGKGVAFDSNDGVKSSSCGNIGTGDFAATIIFSAGSPIVNGYMFSHRDPSNAYQFGMRNVASGYNNFTTYDGAESAISTSIATNDGNEHIMSVRRVGTSMKIFIDGVERADGTLTVRNIATTQQYTVGYNGVTTFSNSNIFLARNYIGTLSTDYILTTHKNLNNPTTSGTSPFYKSISTPQHQRRTPQFIN